MSREELIELKNAMLDANVDLADFYGTDLGFSLYIHGRFQAMWHIAAKENNINGPTASEFARSCVKYPKAWVQKLSELNEQNANKSHKLNFAGSMKGHSNPHGRRDWIVPLFQKFGGPDDVFKDNTAGGARYQSLGEWDRTGKEKKGFIPPHDGAKPMVFDDAYYDAMAESEFTLAPGGAKAFSERYWEAIMVKSIPIINDPKEDTDFHTHTWAGFMDHIGYEHVFQKDYPMEYNKTLADNNFQKWYKYMTFEMGDLTP